MSSPSSRNRVLVASVLALVMGGVAPSSWGAEPRPRGDRVSDDAPATQPRGARGDNGIVVDGDEERAADARRRRANEDDWFRDRAYRDDYARRGPGSVNGEFPSAEVGDF